MLTEVLIYNNFTNKIERFFRKETQPMPYSEGGALRVMDFRASSDSSLLWTDMRTVRAWDAFLRCCACQHKPAKGFARIWEGGEGSQSEHSAGLELDLDIPSHPAEYRQLCRSLHRFGDWSRVRMDEAGRVHMDKRLSRPGDVAAGYPPLRKGAVGTYVLVLQDALAVLGISRCGLSGYFDDALQSALRQYQQSRGIHADGRACRITWNMLCAEAFAAGHTNTVLRP